MGEILFGGVGSVVRPFEGTGAEVPSRLVKASGFSIFFLSRSFIVTFVLVLS